MKILTLSTHDTQCGIATYNHSLMCALKAKGATVEVHPIDSSYLLADSKEEMLSFISCFIQRAKSFDAIVIQHEHGLLHGRFSHKVGQEMFSRLIDGIAAIKKPTVVIFHSEPLALSKKKFFSREKFIQVRIKKRFNCSTCLVAAVHGRDGRSKYLEYGLLDHKVWQIEHPFPETDLLPMAADGAGNVCLTIFGFVSDYKGYAEAIFALAELPDNYHLCVAGGPHPSHLRNELYGRLVNLQESGPLAGRIRVTGWLSDEELRSVMEKTTIVLACYHPNGPLASGALTWSVGFGRPVIASDTVTFRRIQEEAQCFQLVPPNNPDALKQCILRLSGDEELRRQLVRNGLSYAKLHSWNALAVDLLKKFEELKSE